MNRLLTTLGLISIMTTTALFSDKPYVIETFEEEVNFFSVEENKSLPIAICDVPMVEENTTTMMNEPLEKRTSYSEAIKKAQDENKILMIAIRATTCHYCDRMESETLSDKEVQEALDANFVTFYVDQDKEELPLGLQAGMTPNFVFVNANEDVFDMAPGLRTPVEFLEVLDRILKESN